MGTGHNLGPLVLNGALDEQAGAHARQKNLDTTRRYRRRAKVVAASPTKLLDL